MLGKRNIFLIGPMGSGKTAVGKYLAKAIGAPFIDSDQEVERRTGVEISYIFEREGEQGFRVRERDAIEALTQQEPLVLATGGGAVLLPENRRTLATRGRVVYLETSISQQVTRVRYGKHRPLIADVDPREKLTQLMEHRAPLYHEIADVTVATDGRRVQSVGEEILRKLGVGPPAP
jgi:shikimate kinase